MSVRDEIDAINSRFFEAFTKRDAAGCVKDYAEDCIAVYDNETPIRGRAAIQKSYAEVLARGVTLKSLRTVDAQMDGNWGFCVLEFDSSDGHGLSLGVLKRGSNGSLVTVAEAILAAS